MHFYKVSTPLPRTQGLNQNIPSSPEATSRPASPWLAPRHRFVWPGFELHVNGITQFVLFWRWLLPLSLMLRLIRIGDHHRSFCFIAVLCLDAPWLTYAFSSDEQSGAVTDGTATNIPAHVFRWTLVLIFTGICPGMALLGHRVRSCSA